MKAAYATFEADTWVELTSEVNYLLGVPSLMAKLSQLEASQLILSPDSCFGIPLSDINVLTKPEVWRRDQTESDIVLKGGAVPIDATEKTPKWIELEVACRCGSRPAARIAKGGGC